jgi:ketosteroid isomerase-like protein
VARRPQPPTAAVISFIDCINRGNVDDLAALMTEDHTLVVLDEAPLVGRAANVAAWRGYLSSFQDYVISPRHVGASGSRVAVLGTTTGSHLGLPDDEERRLTVIWLAEVTDGRLTRWQVAEDEPGLRRECGIPLDA